MPFTSGVFVNVAGATSALAGQVIQSATWDAIHEDYATAFNQVMGQLITTPSIRNILWMNGGVEVWQRGTSVSVAASNTLYTTDRWYLITNANQNSVVSRQAGLTDESQWAARIQRNAAETGTGVMRFAYPCTNPEAHRSQGNLLALSFIIRAGANWSPASGTLNYAVYAGTASPTKRGAVAYTGETTVISGSVNLTAGGSAQLVSTLSSVVSPTTTEQLEVQFNWTPVGTAGADDWIEIDDVQLEAGLSTNTFTPTSFDRIPLQLMQYGCKTHYQKTFPISSTPESGGGIANSIKVYTQAAETFGYWWVFEPELRASPSYSKYHPTTATSSNWLNVSTGASSSATFATFTSADTTKGIMIIASASASAVASIMAIHAAVSAGI